MGTMKDMRITFFYTDQKVYDTIKESGGERETLVNWANLFYKKFDLQLDVFPIPFNEALYKQKFCFKETNGTKADYSLNAFYEYLDKNVMPAKQAVIDANNRLLGITTDPAARIPLLEENIKLLQEITEFHREHTDFLTHSQRFELEFRKEIFAKMKDFKPTVDKERLPVIFCRFENRVARMQKILTIGQTFDLKLEDSIGSIIFWSLMIVVTGDIPLYKGPLIIIDIDAIKQVTQWVLAHEIVHAAGNTTLDNKGSKDNIMNYADARKYTRLPSKLNLEPTDKTKIEAAFFVV